MSKFTHPEPIEKEVLLDPTKVIMSKTDYKGVIQYANDYFVSICGYQEYELMGKPHNIIRHPDMPKVIFKFMWERLFKGENIHAAVKNLTKDGGYYWVITTFETTYDEVGNIKAHYARRKAIPPKAKKPFEELYAKILKIEKQDIKVAEKYFFSLIEESGMSYDELFLSILGMNEEELNVYFQSKEQNTNATNENTILDIDINQIKQHENTQNDELKQSIEDLQKQIKILQSELINKQENPKPKKGFFRRLFY